MSTVNNNINVNPTIQLLTINNYQYAVNWLDVSDLL